MKKELMVCTCGNSKNEIYIEFKENKMQKIFVRCPKCGKESLVAHLKEK
jgi:ribosomal protein S27AE